MRLVVSVSSDNNVEAWIVEEIQCNAGPSVSGPEMVSHSSSHT